MNIDLIYLFIISLLFSHAKGNIAQLNKLLHTVRCKENSPQHNLKYGFGEITNHKDQLFCEKYARRTCCDAKNFDQLQFKWWKFFASNELSPTCYEALSDLFCYDCDADIGQGIRKDLCEYTCHTIYNKCQDDYFYIDPNSNNKIFPCNKNALLCSQLSAITRDVKEFCGLLGYEVNSYSQIEDDFFMNIIQNKSFTPICFDSRPSSQTFGNALKFTEKERSGSILMPLTIVYTVMLYVIHNLL